MRKQFALQVASTSFATYTFFLTGRQPQRFLLSRATGLMTMTDMIPSTSLHLSKRARSLTVNRFAKYAAGLREH